MRGVLRCWRKVFSGLLLFLLVAACGVTSRAFAERALLGDLTGTPTGTFAWPRGLAVDGANDLWVLDESPESEELGRARIDEFGSSLTFLDQGNGRQPKTKEVKEVEEAEKGGKLVCKSKPKSTEWVAKYWKGEHLWSIAFSASSGNLYLDDGGEGQMWMLGPEDCALQDILASWSNFERSENGFHSQAVVDNSTDPFRGDVYAFSEALAVGHPTSIYRVEPKANSEGHSVAVPFGCVAPYIEEGIIRGAPTGPGRAVEDWFARNVSPGQLVVDPATGSLYAAVGSGVDEFEPSGCFVRRFTAANGHLSEIEGMTFDPVTGDVVVSGSYSQGEHAVIDEFSSSGLLLEEMTEADGVLLGYLQNVSKESNDLAVDSSGDLFVAVGPSHLVDEFGPYKAPSKYSLEVEEPGSGSGSGSVTSEPSGIDCPSTCRAEFTKAEGTVRLKEAPGMGSTFGGWVVEPGTDVVSGCTSVSVECEVMMNGPVKVKAKFDSNLALVEVKETGSGSGTGASEPPGIDCPSTCKAEFTKGKPVELKEKASAGSSFKGWKVEGEAVVVAGCTGLEETCKFEANGLVKVEVVFESEASPVLTVEERGSGSGLVTSEPSGIDCPSTCSAPFTKGETVVLKEKESAGSSFKEWKVEGEAVVVAGCTDMDVTCTVAMNGPVSVKVVFDSKLALVEVEETGSGSGMVASEPLGIDCPSTCKAEFTKGKPVEFKEKVSAGSSFKGWKVEGEAVVTAGCTGMEETCKFEVNGAVKVKAIFESNLALVEVEEPGFGSGTVTSQPAGIECPGVLTCSWEFPEGKSVELKEKASAGSSFKGWKVEGGAVVTAGCTGTEATCTVMVDGAVKVGVMFAPIPPVLDEFSVSVSGDGTVGSREGAESGPISGCTATGGGTCAAEVQEGTVLTLMERPGTGQRFAGWSGACSGTKICTVTVDAVTSVEAVFEPIVDALSVHTSGAGAGTVTSSPMGIDCGSTCSASFEEGTTVILAATPEPGSTFNGWSGCGAEPEGKCEVTLTAAASVTATFALIPPKPLEVVGQAALIPVPPPSVPVVPPSNKFAARATVKGATASLELVLPGPGAVSVSGTDLKSARANPTTAGPLTLKLSLTTTGVRALNKHKRLTVHVTIVFQPTDGTPGSMTSTVVLTTAKSKSRRRR